MAINKKKWAFLCVLGAAAALAYIVYSRQAAEAPAEGRRGPGGGRPMPVVSAPVKRGDIDATVSALGTVTARNTAVVKPRVDGLLQHIAFREGQMVKAGEVLAEIDPRTFQAQLDQASGQLARDEALLGIAKLDLERYRQLLAKDSIARQQVEAQEALVKQYQGAVLLDQGNVANARLQLGFTRITAPIPGQLGLRQVDVGNMVRASDANGIVTITQTQPIMTLFSIPADTLGAVVKQVRAGQSLQVEAWDREGKNRLATGKLLSFDNQIDTTTGTVKLKAEFANADNALYPNQFVNVRLRVETRRDATLVPVAAILRGTPGTFVYVVNGEDKTVRVRPVVIGTATPELVAVEKGLQPGETVVVDGTDKLRDGARVELPVAEGGERKNPQAGEGSGPRGERKRRAEGGPGGEGKSGGREGNAGKSRE